MQKSLTMQTECQFGGFITFGMFVMHFRWSEVQGAANSKFGVQRAFWTPETPQSWAPTHLTVMCMHVPGQMLRAGQPNAAQGWFNAAQGRFNAAQGWFNAAQGRFNAAKIWFNAAQGRFNAAKIWFRNKAETASKGLKAALGGSPQALNWLPPACAQHWCYTQRVQWCTWHLCILQAALG